MSARRPGARAPIARASGLRAGGRRRVVKEPAGRFAFSPSERVADSLPEALAVLQLLELARSRDLDVRVGADAEAAAGAVVGHPVEDAVAEVRLRDAGTG